ncbi:hypothetical protein ATCCBAA256_07660 [Mycobacterium montefiorense]|nr:hypothetical protein ATCCBAA256_07660 [Mycobacterium montefiorense]
MPLAKVSALAMANGAHIERTATGQTYAFVLLPNQIFVKGYQIARFETGSNALLTAVTEPF